MTLFQDAERFKHRVSNSWHDFADFHKFIIIIIITITELDNVF